MDGEHPEKEAPISGQLSSDFTGPPDWTFELDDGDRPVRPEDIDQAIEVARGAMRGVRSTIESLRVVQAHAEKCLRAAHEAGVSVEDLADECDLRPTALQAILAGQPLLPRFN